MRLITVKMYNDIIKLDVGHETAIKGTAHALGLPPERVKEWVGKQKRQDESFLAFKFWLTKTVDWRSSGSSLEGHKLSAS